MKLPPDVLAAKERMERADAALHAYIQKTVVDAALHAIQKTVADDEVKHIRLLDELQLATDDYIEKITAAVKCRIGRPLYSLESHEGKC